jgi:hypothetical protein
MSVAIIACVERGPLESQTILLCRSIRRFGGRFRDAPIFTYQPRIGHDISPTTRAVLDELGVVHRTEVVNHSFVHYPVGNKIFACARAEETLNEEILVFLDSDTILTGEPAEFDLARDLDAAVRPAHSVGHNSSGPGHPMDAYWLSVYQLFGIEDQRYVETELGTITRAYFSAGLIVVRREAGLLGRWKSSFEKLVDSGCLPMSGISRADEVALAVTLVSTMERVKILDGRYNYLIFKRAQLLPPWDRAQLEDLIHVHYRKTFTDGGFLRHLDPPLDPGSKVLRWLEQYLPLTDRIS